VQIVSTYAHHACMRMRLLTSVKYTHKHMHVFRA
jgi:hypothetical protein